MFKKILGIILFSSSLIATCRSETLPCLEVTDISSPSYSQEEQLLGCTQRTEVNKVYTLVVFTQVHCSACRPLISNMNSTWNRLGGNTTIRVVILDQFSPMVVEYANKASLRNVFVGNDKTDRSNFRRAWGIRYTPSLILFKQNGEELYRAPARNERRGANEFDINVVETITKNSL